MKKNKWYLVAGISVLAMAFTGCTRKENVDPEKQVTESTIQGNESYEEGKMQTISGKEIEIAKENEKFAVADAAGLAIVFPDAWEGISMTDKSAVSYNVSDDNMMLLYFSEKIADPELEKELEGKSEEEVLKVYQKYMLPFIQLYRGDEKSKRFAELSKDYQKYEYLGQWNDDGYYLMYDEDFTADKYSEINDADRERLNKMMESLDSLKENIIVFSPEKTEGSLGETAIGALREFDVKDLDGNKVEDISFETYDLTMINVWATWCGPCVGELPDLAALYQELPEGVNLVTICTDGLEENELAKEILEDSKAQFKTYVGDSGLNPFIQQIYSYPTTVFVNSQGEQVGEIVEGALSKEAYKKEIEKRLS